MNSLPPEDDSDAHGPSAGSGHNAAFSPTQWSVILTAADSASPDADEALAQLCRDYWYPLYVFVRRKGFSADDAQDLTQSFFARLIEKKTLQSADPTRGKFRSFLLTCLQNFLRNESDRRRTEKRGGHALIFSFDDATAESRYRLEPVDDATPEKIFERRWALTLLEKVHAQLKKEYVTAGKSKQFEALQVYLSGEPSAGDYGKSAEQLGCNEGAVRVAVHRLRRRMGQLLKEEVSRTLADPSDVDAEISHLLSALR